MGAEKAPEEHPVGVKRRLAAFAFADVAGFSRLMAMNDVETVGKWKSLRTEVLEPHLARHDGHIIDIVGDALFVEFASPVNAVAWAIDVQRSISSSIKDIDPHGLRLRIGINVDDVIDDEGLLQGDGINIAARIHQAAEPGQVVLTSAVHDFVRNRMPATFMDLGTPPMKNIDRPVRVLAVQWEGSEPIAGIAQPYLQWSTRPTLAVLPFRNIGGAEEDRYFGEGITEDIITGLSHSRSLYVIARTSALQYRDRRKDMRQIAHELSVRYILDGSVRRQNSRLRINAELIDAVNTRSVWAERYDGTNNEIFEFQDRIAARIVSSVEPQVQAAETARIVSRPTDSLDAYDCVLKAMSKLYLFTRESFRDTEELLNRAILLDPSYAQAHTYMAWRLNFWFGEGYSADPAKDRVRALAAAQRSIELDAHDSFGLAVSGHTISFMDGRPNEAVELFDRALVLNENSAFAWALSALTFAYLGRPDEALERMQNVWRLSPFDPLNFYFWIVAGIAEFVAGRYDEAIVWLRRSNRANPRFVASLRMLAASLALAGAKAKAVAVGRALLEVEPNFTISSFIKWYPLQRHEDLSKLAAGLESAGLPK